MLRKRNRSAQKDQQMGGFGSENCLQSGVLGQKQKTNAFFNVPGLFVGLSPRSALECDAVRSPTSPLDMKLFSNLSSPFWFSKPSFEGHQKSWDCNKVGLGSIVDDDASRNLAEKPIALSNSKTILIGLQIRSKGPGPSSPTYADYSEGPKSLPKNYPIFSKTKPRLSNLHKGSSDVLFEIGGDPLGTDPSETFQSFSLDSKRLGSEIHRLGSTRTVDFRPRNSRLEKVSVPTGSSSMSLEEIELSEDYTCVISHGPVPKTTHIFGDRVLEGHPNGDEAIRFSAPSSYPTNDFLSYCSYCEKKLLDGKDIYMYRGEKAFCSWDCRMEEISIEEEQEKSMSNASKSENDDDILESSIFVAI